MQATETVRSQVQLLNCLKILYPDKLIEINSRKTIKDITDKWLEVDLLIQDINLGFEYQDAHHYVTEWYYHQSLDNIRSRDTLKIELMRRKNITLIPVPCWWDGSVSALYSEIVFARPDLKESNNNKSHINISLNPEPYFFPMRVIPGVGELMLASFHVALPNFQSDLSPENFWWMGEKYDGIRFCWNPRDNALYTRRGKRAYVTRAMVKQLPKHLFLDGEFWFGRGTTEEAYQVLGMGDASWDNCRLAVFDVPSLDLQREPFEDRYTLLLSLPSTHPFLVTAVRLKLEGIKEMNKLLGLILKDQGEGIMARRPGSMYVTGRSTNLLKIKSTRSDREAIVVAVSDKGAVRLKLPDNNVFTIQSKNIEIKTPLKKGEVVTFTFESLSNKGMPLHARIVRIRSDLSWDDVVAAYKSENKEDSIVEREMPLGFLERKHRQVREFFEKFARNRNRDPLDPESWYDIQAAEIKAVRGGAWIMQQMGWELPRILPEVFSEVKFNTNFFLWRPKLQIDIRRRREYFIKLAEEKGFNPLVAEGWYNFKPSTLDPMGLKLMRFYRFSTSKVIANLFPEIKFDITKFRSVTHGYWKSIENRRSFFVKFAEEHAFDPLVPEHWYNAFHTTGLAKNKNAHGISLYYQSSIPRALASLFPDIGLRLPRFNTKIVNFLKDISNLRVFYEEFALRFNFDPLVPENWRNVRKRDLLKAKGGNAAKEVTGGSLLKGLRTAFPEVNFDETHANYVLRTFYSDTRNKRDFFLKLAATKGFDPNNDENWYKLDRRNLIGIEGGATLIVLHGGSLAGALLDAFPNLDATKFTKKKKNTIKKMEEKVFIASQD